MANHEIDIRPWWFWFSDHPQHDRPGAHTMLTAAEMRAAARRLLSAAEDIEDIADIDAGEQ